MLLVGITVLMDQGSYEQLAFGAAIAASMLTVPAVRSSEHEHVIQ